jgi:hypothetical protein
MAASAPASQLADANTISATQAATNPAEPIEQLHQALKLLQAGRYVEADRLATALASRDHPPMPRAWLVAAQARQDLREYAAAAEAYRAFLSASDSPAGREYVNRQLHLCVAATEPAGAGLPPSLRLTDAEKKDLAVVGAAVVTETSEHFAVHARNAALAKLVAQEAEADLKRICGLILGGQEYPHRVEIYAWADQKDYLAHASGAASWSGGAFTFLRGDGKVLRRIDLAQLDEKRAFSGSMLDRAMPHELCHLVTAELFGEAPCPLYLNEGLAMLAEGEPDNDRLELAGTALAGKDKIALADLLVAAGPLERPELFYAEAYSLLLYLRQRLSDRQFAAMIENLKGGSPLSEALQRALHAPEDADFLKNLEAAWERRAIEQAQYIRALRGEGAPDK